MPISTNSEKKDPQLCIIRSGASNVINRNKQKENGKLRKIMKFHSEKQRDKEVRWEKQ